MLAAVLGADDTGQKAKNVGIVLLVLVAIVAVLGLGLLMIAGISKLMESAVAKVIAGLMIPGGCIVAYIFDSGPALGVAVLATMFLGIGLLDI
jgi:hypothetical protein